MYDNILQKLQTERRLSGSEYKYLLETDRYDEELNVAARNKAQEIFGNKVYIRGLIEFTNFCKNNCYYCGIRAGNKCALRFPSTPSVWHLW